MDEGGLASVIGGGGMNSCRPDGSRRLWFVLFLWNRFISLAFATCQIDHGHLSHILSSTVRINKLPLVTKIALGPKNKRQYHPLKVGLPEKL